MPFFPAIILKENKIKDIKLRIPSKRSATLQVRPRLTKFIRFRGKRVWPSSFQCVEQRREKKTPCIYQRAGISGSMSVEAAISLSLFLFAAVCMAMPMRVMDRHRQIQAKLESVCEAFSQYAYLEEYQSGLKAGVWLTAGRITEGIENKGIRNLNIWKSSVMKDKETIDLVIRYEMELPFSVLGLQAIPVENRSVRRAWIGREKTLGSGTAFPEETGETTQEIVYIGRNSTRYHKSPSCHYLSNQLTKISYDSLEAYRNADGGRYHPCQICGKEAEPGSTVYIMPSGESYHTDWSCSSIIAYIEAVPLSEVSHLGKCSYCW